MEDQATDFVVLDKLINEEHEAYKHIPRGEKPIYIEALVAYGLSNWEIAKVTHASLATVRDVRGRVGDDNATESI